MDTKALHKITSGLYVVSTQDGDTVSACLINTGLQLTSSLNADKSSVIITRQL